MTFVPIRDAVIVAGASSGTIRKWAKRGKIATTRDGDIGPVLYSLPDLIHAERATREWKERQSLTQTA